MFSSSACSLRRVPHGVFFPGDLVPTSKWRKHRAADAPCVARTDCTLHRYAGDTRHHRQAGQSGHYSLLKRESAANRNYKYQGRDFSISCRTGPHDLRSPG